MLTYDFRLPPGPRTVEYALLAEELGFRAVWCPEIPAFGHDIWVTLARIAEKTKRIKFGPSVLIPSYRHPMAHDRSGKRESATERRSIAGQSGFRSNCTALHPLPHQGNVRTKKSATSRFTAGIPSTSRTAMTRSSTYPPPGRTAMPTLHLTRAQSVAHARRRGLERPVWRGTT